MSTKANPSPYCCCERAMPDDPMFVLLARERLLLAVKDSAMAVHDGSRMMPQAALRALGDALDEFENWEKANG